MFTVYNGIKVQFYRKFCCRSLLIIAVRLLFAKKTFLLYIPRVHSMRSLILWSQVPSSGDSAVTGEAGTRPRRQPTPRPPTSSLPRTGASPTTTTTTGAQLLNGFLIQLFLSNFRGSKYIYLLERFSHRKEHRSFVLPCHI